MAEIAVLAKDTKDQCIIALHRKAKCAFHGSKQKFHKTHDDEHYAAAAFRYMRKYAIKLKDLCTMVCIDDKHRLKVGEPGFLVAAAEGGER